MCKLRQANEYRLQCLYYVLGEIERGMMEMFEVVLVMLFRSMDVTNVQVLFLGLVEYHTGELSYPLIQQLYPIVLKPQKQPRLSFIRKAPSKCCQFMHHVSSIEASN